MTLSVQQRMVGGRNEAEPTLDWFNHEAYVELEVEMIPGRAAS